MNLPIQGLQKDKLIVALTTEDAVAAINLALRVRRATLTLDYPKDQNPRVMLEMPGVEPESIFQYDYRKRCCYVVPPTNRELFFLMLDIQERLEKIGCQLRLGGEKTRSGARRAILQVLVVGSRQIGLTLMDARRGHRTTRSSFQLPDGTTP